MEEFEPPLPPPEPAWLQVHFGWDALLWLCMAVVFVLWMIQRLKRCEPSDARTLAMFFLIPAPLLVGVMLSLGILLEGLESLIMGYPAGIQESAAEEIAKSYKVLLLAAGCCLPGWLASRSTLWEERCK